MVVEIPADAPPTPTHMWYPLASVLLFSSNLTGHALPVMRKRGYHVTATDTKRC